MSFCGCGQGRHNVSSASCVKSVGTAPAHERAGMTRDKCGALPVKENVFFILKQLFLRIT